MHNRHMHHGPWIAAIVAFSGLVGIEVDKHPRSPLPFAEGIFNISSSRSTQYDHFIHLKTSLLVMLPPMTASLRSWWRWPPGALASRHNIKNPAPRHNTWLLGRIRRTNQLQLLIPAESATKAGAQRHPTV
jgi:hypothetical protein